MTKNVFEESHKTVTCPLCGGSEYTVLSPARYPSSMNLEELRNAFRASSDHMLLDQLVSCNVCQLAYLNPRVTDEILLGGYSDAVDPEFMAQNPERIRTFTRMLKGILSRLGIPEGSGQRILDVGCAGGAFLVAARDCGLKPSGIEPSRWAVEFGRKNYNLDVQQGILTEGVFPPSSFDLVSLWDVIEHVPDPHALLRTIHSVLKPKGTLIVNYPDYGSWAARLLGAKWPFLLSVHLLYYTRTTMQRQLRQAGYRVVEIRPHFQTLPFGYVLRRAAPYVGLAGIAAKIVEAVGLGGIPLRYNVGQTLVVAQRE